MCLQDLENALEDLADEQDNVQECSKSTDDHSGLEVSSYAF